jgi:hypothetical protein
MELVENDTVTTIKLNATQFQQIDKTLFRKAPEFAQICGYVNTPDNSPQDSTYLPNLSLSKSSVIYFIV